jgi:hypothetical protein
MGETTRHHAEVVWDGDRRDLRAHTISYDKPNRRLTLTATIGAGLLHPPETTTTAQRGGR